MHICEFILHIMMAWSVLLQGTLGMAHEPQAHFGAQGTLPTEWCSL